MIQATPAYNHSTGGIKYMVKHSNIRIDIEIVECTIPFYRCTVFGSNGKNYINWWMNFSNHISELSKKIRSSDELASYLLGLLDLDSLESLPEELIKYINILQ